MNERTSNNAHILHLSFVAFACGMAIGNVIYACIALRTMPQTVGYHFDADGTYNLFGDKNIAFLHPLIAEALVTGIFTFLSFLAQKVKYVKGFSENGNKTASICTVFLCDLYSLTAAGFFAHWVYCVAQQIPLDTSLARGLILTCVSAMALLVVGLIAGSIYARLKNGKSTRENL